MKKDIRYCITGINRMTRQRDILTPPCSMEKAVKIMNRELCKPASKREYLYLRREAYPPSATCA